jgi:hypothetical protein
MVQLQGKPVAALYVHRSTQQWIVRDPQGDFWILPVGASWEQREAFVPTAETELESVPGHYKYMLDVPF